jgi:hypothetical protein
MKQLLEIRAINVKDRVKNYPFIRNETVNAIENRERAKVFDILKRCDKEGDILVHKDGVIKELLKVEQILFKGYKEFKNYQTNGFDFLGVDFNSYVMSFKEFQERGRPVQIYVDLDNSINL